MHWFRFAVLLIVATVLQAAILDTISISEIKPDLLLILLVFFAIYRQLTDAIITSFIIGFAHDIIGTSMGPGILSFGILGTGLCYLTNFVTIRTMPFQSIIIFLLGLTTAYLSSLLSHFQSHAQIHITFGVLFGTAVYSAIIGPFLFLPAGWWMNIAIRKERRRRRY